MNYEEYIKSCPCGSQKEFLNCCEQKILNNITQSPIDKQNDNRPDRRIAIIVQTASDSPPAYKGGPSHPKGSYLAVTHFAKYNNDLMGFITPHSSALFLSISVKNATLATKLKNQLKIRDVPSPDGLAKMIYPDNLLYDYYEYAMVSINFAFQSIEAYCNSVISSSIKEKFNLERNGKRSTLTKNEVERKCATDEKLATILPDILTVKSPKGKRVWQNFKILKEFRDSIVHMKSYDMYSHINDSPNTLFYKIYTNHAFIYPRFAFDVIWYFCQTSNAKHQKPYWAERFIDYLGKEIKQF